MPQPSKTYSFDAQDSQYMARAMMLAKRGLYTTHPNPRVGCVIVGADSASNTQQIVGEGWHQLAGQAHAEVHALAQAGDAAKGATAYVTLEPCSHFGRTPPCAQALIKAGVSKVISAMEDPNPLVSGNGHKMLREAGIEVAVGLMADSAESLNPGFCKRMRSGYPWVWLKSAASVDGRTAMSSGESQWITGPEARADVQRLRARVEAIVTGVDSVLYDDCSLTVRPESWPESDFSPYQWPNGFTPLQPLRVILDSRLRLPTDAAILQAPGQVLVVCADASLSERRKALEAAGAEVLCLPDASADKVDLDALLRHLGQAGVNEVLIESGAKTAGSFIAANLVDEWWLYMAPVIMGSDARPLMQLDIQTMAQKRPLVLHDVRQFGNDMRMRYRLAN